MCAKRGFGLLAVAVIAGAAFAEGPEFEGVDPLRQMGSSTAKPFVYLFLDLSKTMGNPLEIGDDQGNEPWYINNFGGWRFIQDSPTFPYGPGGNELCGAFSDVVEIGNTAAWTLSSKNPQHPNLWHIVTEPDCSPSSASGSSSWYFGCSPEYLLTNPANCVPCTFEIADPVADCPDRGCTARGNRCDRANLLCRRRVQGAIESPPIATQANDSTAKISFWSRAATEDSTKYDQKRVEVRAQDSTGVWGSWQLVDFVTDVSGVWIPQLFDLSPHLAPGDIIQIRFVFDSVDYANNRGLGWMVDNIRVIYSDWECAGFAWYEPSRISTVKQVLGDSVAVASFRTEEGCDKGIDLKGPDGSTPYRLAPDAGRNLTCDERTVPPCGESDCTDGIDNDADGFIDETIYLAPRLEELGIANPTAEGSVLAAASVYSTWLCLSDAHGVPHAGSADGLLHSEWNASPCAYFSDILPPINIDLQTSYGWEDSFHTLSCAPDAKDDLVPNGALYHTTNCPKEIISSVSGMMNFGLMVGASNVSKAINGGNTGYNDDAFDAAANPTGYITDGGIGHLVPVNPDDDDIAGQRYNTDRINAYFREWGESTTIAKPDGSPAVTIGGLGVTDQPTFPIQQSDAAGQAMVNIFTTMSDPENPNYDPRNACRDGYIILLIDSFFTSGSEQSCKGQMAATEERLATLATQRVRTFVVQFGPSGRRYNANRLAFFGRTDASSVLLDAGLKLGDDGLPEDPALAAFDANGYTSDPNCDSPHCACRNTDDEIYDYAYFAENGEQLYKALTDIIDAITAGDFVTAPPSVTVTAGSAGEDRAIGLLTSAQSPGWKGHVRAFNLDDQDPDTKEFAEVWDAGAALTDRTTLADGVTKRDIWSSEFGSNQLFEIWGNETKAATKLTASFDLMKTNGLASFPATGFTAVVDEETNEDCSIINIHELVDFIKGFDGTQSGRQRPWLLGDLVNISPILVQKPLDFLLNTAANKKTFDATYDTERHPVVYAPANDGLLHVLDAMDGYEVWAYLPPTQIDNVAELYCNFKTEYDERQKDCPTCGESDCADKIDNDGDGKTDETICSPAELDAILYGDMTATPPVAPLRNPTGQNPLYVDHVYGLAAAPRVGEIRTKWNPGCTADTGPEPGEFCKREWSTVLFIGEGAGGESYYALDVTHPYGLDRPSLKDPLTDPKSDYQGDEDPCYGFVENCDVLQPKSGTTAGAPFRVLWRIGPDKTGFEGLGESWSTVPVGLIEDPAASGEPQRRETFAIAFGSYHRDPEVERCAPYPCPGPKADNRYWIVRAEDGVLLQDSNNFANGEKSAAGFVLDGGKAYVDSITAAPPGDLSLSYDTKGECEAALGDTCSNDNADRAKPKIPNSTLPDVIMMETSFPSGIAPRFYPDGVVTHVFQADLHGRIWAANISGTDPAWNLSDWTSEWRQWRLFDPLDAPSAKIGIDSGNLVSVSDGGYWKASEGNPTVIGSQPIHYTPAIGHFTSNRYAVAFSTGGWAETHPNVTGERFAPFLVLFITDQHLGDPGSCGEADCTNGVDDDGDTLIDESGRDPNTHGICQAWVKRVDEIIIYDAPEDGCGESDCTNGIDDDDDGLIDEGISTNNTVSRVARVTGSPLLVIRQSQADDPSTPDVNESNLPTSGTAIFTIYDPEEIEVESGLCVGTSYAILVDFHHDGSFEDCTEAGTAVAQAISIGVGFRTLTAGPTSPIMAASGVGSGSQATLASVPGSQWPTPGPDIIVLSWQELSCDY